ncbi:uncharacterized protein LOC127789810 [Diospyros lotus]|uniref:uncharacterized protein LOC127789810 n=1 Tax=Diospyros lotus TaxID=55363 RepID=UPI00224FF19D|nr:uncharacterized protein LOC127789810 [Diospyros lotus]
MTSPITYPVDDKDLDDAALWAVIDSAAASISSATKPRKAFGPKIPIHHQHSHQPPSPSSVSKNARSYYSPESDCRLARPQKMARHCVSDLTEASPPLAVIKHVQRTPSYRSPESGGVLVKECSPTASECSPVFEERDCMRHSLSGRFPSVSLFKEYQKAAMAILERTDYTMISGNPFIKKSGWRKISCYFNISYEIKDKSIEFDDRRNVLRSEFVVRAYMNGGRFSDGWGSCERSEKRFSKPNHDIPSTAETRAKNKACQDLLGIGEYKPGASHGHQ